MNRQMDMWIEVKDQRTAQQLFLVVKTITSLLEKKCRYVRKMECGQTNHRHV